MGALVCLALGLRIGVGGHSDASTIIDEILNSLEPHGTSQFEEFQRATGSTSAAISPNRSAASS
jgi:hypothetical protein